MRRLTTEIRSEEYVVRRFRRCANVYQWRTQEFFSGLGFQQINLRTEGRENGDLGAVAP
jgi:hypothetical protein